MKNLIVHTMAFLFAVTLFLAGTSNAGFFGSDEEVKTKSDTAATATEQLKPADEPLTLSGSIDENSRFVDDSGQIYTLADNDKGMEIKTLSGQKVEIKGTVMEEAGQKTVEVKEYNIIE